ncbi:unnamed protein product [Natator depressus]
MQVAESRSVSQSLILAEVTRVGDLLDYDWGDWLDPLMLARRMGLSRPCTPRRVLQEVKAALPPTARAYLDRVLLKGTPRPPSTPGPPDLLIGPLPRRPNRPSHPFTASRLHELQPVYFQTVPRKHLYTLVPFTPFMPSPYCPAPTQSCETFCHLWRVSSPNGPAYIPPWFRGPLGTSVGGSFTEL